MHLRTWALWLLPVSILWTFGCGGGAPSQPDDAGVTDAGHLPADAGTAPDAGGDPDGGTAPDAGVDPDGGTPCASPQECPGEDTDCQSRTCQAGVCGMDLTAQGTPTSSQTAGDCRVEVCDGSGGTEVATDEGDAPDPGTACRTTTCDGDVPVSTFGPVGAACSDSGGQVCDGNGACVECLVGGDCPSGVCVQATNTCAAPTCSDGIMNGMETGVDCGGPACAACSTLLTLSRTASGLATSSFDGNTQVWTFGTLSSTAVSRPVVVSVPAEDYAVGLWQGTSDALVYAVWEGGGWSSPGALGPAITTRAAPAATALGADLVTLFHGQDFKHYLATWSNGAWLAPEPVGTPSDHSFGPHPGAVAAVGSELVVLYADGGAANDLYARSRSGGTWSAPSLVATGVDFNLRPALSAGGLGALTAAWVRQDGVILYAARQGGVWSAPAELPGASTPGDFALGTDGMGQAAVAFRGHDGHLYISVYLAGAWQPPQQLAAGVTGEPALAPGVGGAVAEILYVQNGDLQHARIVGLSFVAPVVAHPGVSDVTAASIP